LNFFFYNNKIENVNCIVLKTGPDRPVELVRAETGEVAGSSKPTDRPCNQTSVNRHDPARTGQNRRLGGFSNRTGSLFRKERTEEWSLRARRKEPTSWRRAFKSIFGRITYIWRRRKIKRNNKGNVSQAKRKRVLSMKVF